MQQGKIMEILTTKYQIQIQNIKDYVNFVILKLNGSVVINMGYLSKLVIKHIIQFKHMQTPIKKYWEVPRGYTHGVPTFYTPKHRGVDLIVRTGTAHYASVDGNLTTGWGDESGYHAILTTDTLQFRSFHLSEFVRKSGKVAKGELIAYTGNTGLTTGPHLHHDIYDLTKGKFDLNKFENFIDPDKFYRMYRLIKAIGDPKVYALDDNGVKHWIISETQFLEGQQQNLWGTDITEMTSKDFSVIPEGTSLTFLV